MRLQQVLIEPGWYQVKLDQCAVNFREAFTSGPSGSLPRLKTSRWHWILGARLAMHTVSRGASLVTGRSETRPQVVAKAVAKAVLRRARSLRRGGEGPGEEHHEGGQEEALCRPPTWALKETLDDKRAGKLGRRTGVGEADSVSGDVAGRACHDFQQSWEGEEAAWTRPQTWPRTRRE